MIFCKSVPWGERTAKKYLLSNTLLNVCISDNNKEGGVFDKLPMTLATNTPLALNLLLAREKNSRVVKWLGVEYTEEKASENMRSYFFGESCNNLLPSSTTL